MPTKKSFPPLRTRWAIIFLLIISFVANPVLAKIDSWDASQKNLIASCEDWNPCLELLIPGFEEYRNPLENAQPEQAKKDNAQRLLDNAEGLNCTNDVQVSAKKEQTDLLLRLISIAKAINTDLDFLIEGTRAGGDKDSEKKLERLKN